MDAQNSDKPEDIEAAQRVQRNALGSLAAFRVPRTASELAQRYGPQATVLPFPDYQRAQVEAQAGGHFLGLLTANVRRYMEVKNDFEKQEARMIIEARKGIKALQREFAAQADMDGRANFETSKGAEDA